MPRPTARPGRPYSDAAIHTQDLPFTVRIATTRDELQGALRLRQTAYSRHLPAMAERLAHPEPDDLKSDAVLLVAQHKLDGRILGSVRLLTNGDEPLGIESETQLPARFKDKRLIEARRLTVCSGPDNRMVTPALIKAIYEISYRCGQDVFLLTAREPLDRMYRAMQFQDALDGQKLILSDVANVPHSLFYMDVVTADAQWKTSRWPLYGFLAGTSHPDISIDFILAEQVLNVCPAEDRAVETSAS